MARTRRAKSCLEWDKGSPLPSFFWNKGDTAQAWEGSLGSSQRIMPDPVSLTPPRALPWDPSWLRCAHLRGRQRHGKRPPYEGFSFEKQLRTLWVCPRNFAGTFFSTNFLLYSYLLPALLNLFLTKWARARARTQALTAGSCGPGLGLPVQETKT